MAVGKQGRDAGAGKFITVREAERRKKPAVVEIVKQEPKKGKK